MLMATRPLPLGQGGSREWWGLWQIGPLVPTRGHPAHSSSGYHMFHTLLLKRAWKSLWIFIGKAFTFNYCSVIQM